MGSTKYDRLIRGLLLAELLIGYGEGTDGIGDPVGVVSEREAVQ